jgi:hypothetical protein
MGRHTFTITLEESFSRRLRALLNSPEHGYASLNELIEVALTNQLNAEASRERHNPVRNARGSAELEATVAHDMEATRDLMTGLLDRPPVASPLPLATPRLLDGTLSSLTNRFGPIKIAVRVCANMADEEWPAVSAFRDQAAEAARQVGLRLRDKEPESRRWVALPVGEDIEKTKTRYANSFTIGETGGVVVGPLALLGLADVSEGHVILTKAGWRLAAAPSALLDEMPSGGTLSRPEIDILRSQLLAVAAELGAVKDFLRFVESSKGKQSKLDDHLQSAHPDWSRDAVVAHRAAMLGRLGDLNAVEVAGRGTSAIIRTLADGLALANPTANRAVEV